MEYPWSVPESSKRMDRRTSSQAALIGLAVALGILWALKPAHPSGALSILIDGAGIVLTIGWIVIAVGLARAAVDWSRSIRRRGLRSVLSGWTLQTAMPLLVCLAGLGVIGLLVALMA